ncbi:hypothetical protein HZH66_002422 [Vespula vulgaris]|uniref:Uncharacterized protein n=1 Tax=Vespula vulgaris TaxID=7454 RepID=A0A834NG80_VESVU|nr:hypothetical protein HZH66_002422 [Vespula vulgaris]
MAVVTEGKTGSCEVLATIYLLTFHSPPNSYQRKYCLAMVASHEAGTLIQICELAHSEQVRGAKYKSRRREWWLDRQDRIEFAMQTWLTALAPFGLVEPSRHCEGERVGEGRQAGGPLRLVWVPNTNQLCQLAPTKVDMLDIAGKFSPFSQGFSVNAGTKNGRCLYPESEEKYKVL